MQTDFLPVKILFLGHVILHHTHFSCEYYIWVQLACILPKNERNCARSASSDMVAGCLFTIYRLRFYQHMAIPGLFLMYTYIATINTIMLVTRSLVDRGKVIPGYYVPMLRKSLQQHPHLVYFSRKRVKINLSVHIYQLLVIMSVMLSGIHARLILRDQNLPRRHFETI